MSLASFGVLCFSSLFTVIDPISTAPVFASMTRGLSPKRTREIAVKACLVALSVLLVFAVSGAFVFRLFGITIDAFRIGGGIVFATLGLRILTAKSHEAAPTEVTGDPSVVPLGVPLIGGPGSITTVMVLMGQAARPVEVAVVLSSLVLAMLLTCALLVLAPLVTRRLGHAGLELVTKVMGLIVLVIGIQFIINGAKPVLVDVLSTVRG